MREGGASGVEPEDFDSRELVVSALGERGEIVSREALLVRGHVPERPPHGLLARDADRQALDSTARASGVYSKSLPFSFSVRTFSSAHPAATFVREASAPTSRMIACSVLRSSAISAVSFAKGSANAESSLLRRQRWTSCRPNVAPGEMILEVDVESGGHEVVVSRRSRTETSVRAPRLGAGRRLSDLLTGEARCGGALEKPALGGEARPWQGHSHVLSASLQATRQPRCGQRAERTCVLPDSSR